MNTDRLETLRSFTRGELDRLQVSRKLGMSYYQVIQNLEIEGLATFELPHAHEMATAFIKRETTAMVISDAGPLISLALRRSLNVLLQTNAKIYTTDQVCEEVTSETPQHATDAIRNFLSENADQINVFETMFSRFPQIDRERPGVREGAAAQFLACLDEIIGESEYQATILLEDCDIQHRHFHLPDNIQILSTGALLLAKRIQNKQIN